MAMDNRISRVRIDSETILQDVRFASTTASPLCTASFELAFLGVVDTSKIPLSFIAGPSSDVWTSDEATLTWFAEQLTPTDTNVSVASHLGVLVAIEGRSNELDASSMLTEILFHATMAYSHGTESEGNPALSLKAIPLCSQVPSYLPSPPLSPQHVTGEVDAQLLPSLETLRATTLAAEKKRKQVSDVFDEATERRRKARRHGGESVAAAASLQNNGVNVLVGQKRPKAIHKRQGSAATYSSGKPQQDHNIATNFQQPRSRTRSVSGHAHEQSRRVLSRSPSMSSDVRPGSRRGPVDALAKRSTLSRVSSLSEASSVEQRNKDAISRLVMAGMRLYGLQPRKREGHTRRYSEIAVHVADAATQEAAPKDDEYKLIYHQTYKSAVFALRRTIATEPLHANPARLQDTIDKLLAIFCTDPLEPVFGAAPTSEVFGAEMDELQPT